MTDFTEEDIWNWYYLHDNEWQNQIWTDSEAETEEDFYTYLEQLYKLINEN